MKSLALASALAASSWGGLLGFGSHKIVVLWVPSESFSSWDALDQILQKYSDLRLTVGLSPDAVSPEGRKVVARWIENGRLEPALRLKGDPILPLIVEQPSAPRPEDAPARLAEERQKFKDAFGVFPKGFAPGGGAVDAVVLAALKSMSLSWIAVGDYPASTSTWATAAGVVLVPLRPADTLGRELTAESLTLPSYPHPFAFVVDEADALVPDGSFLRLLSALSEKRPSNGWATISETAPDRRLIPAPATMGWPTWTGDLSRWTSHPASRAAWSLYAEAAAAVERYQNSGQADLKNLEAATAALYEAQASRFFRADGNEQSPRDLRARLVAVYRALHQTPPDALFAGAAAAARPEETSTDVHFSQGASWLEFDNPSGSLAAAPEGASAVLSVGNGEGEGLPPEDLWRLRSMRVETTEDETTLVYRLARLQAAAGAPIEMGALLLQTYIDINNVIGAGSTSLLDGSGAFIQARDAWEYAVTVSAWGAFLYRSNPLGTPIVVGRLGLSADAQSGEVRVTIPRAYLRGNPTRWGYVVLAMAADPATTGKPPAKPLPGKSGPILGLLAPLEQQKAVLASKESGKRLAALRAR